jgi:hypothetical protein
MVSAFPKSFFVGKKKLPDVKSWKVGLETSRSVKSSPFGAGVWKLLTVGYNLFPKKDAARF